MSTCSTVMVLSFGDQARQQLKQPYVLAMNKAAAMPSWSGGRQLNQAAFACRSGMRYWSDRPGLAQPGDLGGGEPELSQDFVGVLADGRDGAEDGRRTAGADRRGQRPDRAGR